MSLDSISDPNPTVRSFERDRIAGLRSVVAECSAKRCCDACSAWMPYEHSGQKCGACRRLALVLVDLFSASIYLKIYDALNPTNQAKLNALSLTKACRVTMKLA